MKPFSRRTVLQGGIGLGLATAVPAVALAAQPGRVFVFDGRSAEGRRAAKERGGMTFDSAHEGFGRAWRSELPAALAGRPVLEGLTTWSALLICQGFARERGLNLRSAEPRPGGLYAWTIA
ncbi:hypothetical protein [Tsuneonella sp. HG222]